MDAVRVPPASVVHESTKVESAVSAGVSATPLLRELFAWSLVNEAWSGLEMMQPCIPAVTQPIEERSPELSTFGFATKMSDGLFKLTVHCFESVTP